MRPFFPSFASGDPSALAFLPARAADPIQRAAAARAAATRPVAPELLAELFAQDRALPASARRRAHLEALAAGGAAAVVTGQQVGLFLGPLYTFYKAASAVAYARALEKEAGVPVVPLFWLQTEDHDWREIDHDHVLRPGAEPLRLELPIVGTTDPENSRVSVEHLPIDPRVLELIGRLEEALDGFPHAGEVVSLLVRHYRPGAPMAEAFAGLIAEVFAEEGLVVLDPRRPAVAGLARPIIVRALRDAAPISDALRERSARLEAEGYEVQVRIRPGSPLVFFHPALAEGPRFRLEPGPEGWQVSGPPALFGGASGRLGFDEALRLAEAEPLRFSTSALLRPIVQDSLLPTAAYVGGPGELAYFAQLAPLYESFSLRLPAIAPRARFRIVESGIGSLLRKLGLEAKDLSGPREPILARLAGEARGALPLPETLEAELLDGFTQRLSAFADPATGRDPALGDAIRRTDQSVKRAVGRFTARYRRSLVQRDQVLADRLARVERYLSPGGVPQERFYGLAYFAAKFGLPHFRAKVLESIVPFDPTIREIEP
jgi:bacillithiol biosynthesis cysteine-adding enzyme BshC